MKKRNITKLKGDIGLTQVIADLTKKGYEVSIPIAEHLPYDLIFHDFENNKLYRVQVKYSNKNRIKGATTYLTSKKGTVVTNYEICDFEYYALYLPDISECVYIPNVGTTTISVRSTLPNCYNKELIWWEDYKLPIQTELIYRQSTDINPDFKVTINHKVPKYTTRKVKNRPTKEELQTLIDTTPYVKIGEMYGVSDNAIRKWAKSYGILRNKLKRNRLTIPDHTANLN